MKYKPSSNQARCFTVALKAKAGANPALNLAPFGRWTLRLQAGSGRLALR